MSLATASMSRPRTSTPTSTYRDTSSCRMTVGLDVTPHVGDLVEPNLAAPFGPVDQQLSHVVEAVASVGRAPDDHLEDLLRPRRGCPTSMPESTVAAARRTSPA